MGRKSEHVQIRVTAREKAALKRLATAAGQDVSSYVLARALPASRSRFEALLRALAGNADGHRYVLAELNDLLASWTADELTEAVAHAAQAELTPLLRNYVAAMVEQACYQKRIAPPSWTAAVEPLEHPYFATTLPGLKLHLLRASPVPFRRRNIFVDAGVGARV